MEAAEMLKSCEGENLDGYAIICRSTPIAWEFFKIQRELGKAHGIYQLSGVGDIIRGDDDFNHRLYAHYRLFDDFSPLISSVLKMRLSNEDAPSTPIRRTVGFKEMTYEQIRKYFQDKMI